MIIDCICQSETSIMCNVTIKYGNYNAKVILKLDYKERGKGNYEIHRYALRYIIHRACTA